MANCLIILTFLIFAISAMQPVISEEFPIKNVLSVQTKLHFNFNFTTNISNPVCNGQLSVYQNSLQQNELWARKISDSWGKVPSGLFSGNYFDVGNFDQCIDVRYYSNEVGVIDGQVRV